VPLLAYHIKCKRKRICASCSAAQMNFEVRYRGAENTVYVIHKTTPDPKKPTIK